MGRSAHRPFAVGAAQERHPLGSASADATEKRERRRVLQERRDQKLGFAWRAVVAADPSVDAGDLCEVGLGAGVSSPKAARANVHSPKRRSLGANCAQSWYLATPTAAAKSRFAWIVAVEIPSLSSVAAKRPSAREGRESEA